MYFPLSVLSMAAPVLWPSDQFEFHGVIYCGSVEFHWDEPAERRKQDG